MYFLTAGNLVIYMAAAIVGKVVVTIAEYKIDELINSDN